ncbi:MAG: VOC family protein [Granulosicoccus sp.]|nr:VOC family protein [Granulosicoccus sp.]
MSIYALSYLGIRCPDLDDWSSFACNLLGMERLDRGGKTLALRMDDQQQRLVITNEAGDSLHFIGWEVDSVDDLSAFAEQLESRSINVTVASRALCERRFVTEMISFDDPDGNRIELVWRPVKNNMPFRPGRSISGFVTGAYGMGHAVLHVRDVAELLPFYRDVLGFKVSDYGLTPYPMYFFHVNGRHHSFALIGSGQSGFHHFMIEYQNLDDVGQGYDLAQLEADRIAYTLGRHTNDYMTSYYANSPSGFFVESGWGGRIIEPASWQPAETFDGPSFWGHERLYLPESSRATLRDMRLQAAAKGKRTPPLVDCPWLYQQRS